MASDDRPLTRPLRRQRRARRSRWTWASVVAVVLALAFSIDQERTSAGTQPRPRTYVVRQTPNHAVNTFRDHHRVSGIGPPIAAGQVVRVSCKVYDPSIPSVVPAGYWYRIASRPWNNRYYAPANTFLNGDPPQGPYRRHVDRRIRDCAATPAGSAPPASGGGRTYLVRETPHHPVDTFRDHHRVSGKGPPIAAGQAVRVSCKVYDPSIPSVVPAGYWYRIASRPWNNRYYAPANTFLNGDPPYGPYRRHVDRRVPDC